jgi:hypothetical protein
MRMWMLPPRMLCRKHLLGEHGEIHKHRHIFVKHFDISGRVQPIIQVAPALMQARHDELAREMLARDYQHQSLYELPDLSYLPNWQRNAQVDIQYNLRDLYTRCDACALLIKELGVCVNL